MKIYVGNLSFQTTEQSVQAAFSAFGTVQSVTVMCDRHTGQPRGFGFVEMDTNEATAAIVALNGTELDGRTVTVNEARARATNGRGS
jgi:RNA recognition motif-containing protein